MNEKHLIDSLARMGTRTYETPRHKVALRRALVSTHATRSASVVSEWRSHLGTFLTTKNIFMPIGALALFVLMFTTVSGPESGSQSEARALLERSFARAFSLPPETQARLAESMDTDLATAYSEAKEASDLRVVTADEFAMNSSALSDTAPMRPEARMMKASAPVAEEMAVDTMAFGASSAESAPVSDMMLLSAPADVGSVSIESAPAPVAYLSYTDKNGRTILIGIDADDTPILRIITSDSGEEIVK